MCSGGKPHRFGQDACLETGYAGVMALVEMAAPCMVGVEEGRIARHPLADSWTRKKELDTLLVTLVSELQ